MPPLSPYPLVPKKDKENSSTIYWFETDYNVKYELVFKSDSDYLPDESLAENAYSFILTRVSDKAGVVDSRIRDTVTYGLLAAFDANPNLIITYTCSTDNNQEKQRALLFRRWFLQCRDNYKSIDFSDSKRIYATAIYRKDHPEQDRIIDAFLQIYRDK
ncbi:hypothetical protein GCM10028805_12200 [Spirosoma harenae]